MSLRAASQRLLQNGRLLLRILRPQNHKDVVEGAKFNILPQGANNTKSSLKSSSVVQSAVRSVGFQARRLFVDNVLRRVTNSLSGDLRKRATKRLFFGDSAPFFALVGVSLASGTGILTKDDELEGVCWEIREAVSKMQWNFAKTEYVENRVEDEESVGLNALVLGPVIAKGCSAVVYAARKKEEVEKNVAQQNITVDTTGELCSFPMAIKMMFNYDAESNAMSILRAMYRETVPAQKREQNMADRKKPLPPHPNIVQMYYVFADRVPLLPGSSEYSDALPARINPMGYGRNMSLFLLMKRYECSLKQYLQDKSPSVRVSMLLLAQLLEGVAHINMHGIAHRDLKCDNILLDLSEGDDTCPLLVVTDFGCCLADRVHGLSLPYHSPDTDKGGNTALMAPEVVLAEPGPFTSINYSKSDAWAVGAIAYEIFGQENPFYSSMAGAKSLMRNATYSEDDLPPLPDNVPPIISNLVHNLLTRNPRRRLSAEAAATVCQLLLWAPSAWLRADHPDLPTSNEILQWLLCLTTKVLCEGRKHGIVMSSANLSSRHTVEGIVSPPSGIGSRRTLPEYQLIASFLMRVKLRQIRAALNWIYGT
ncbi:hypothetical protein L9F63_013838 [Diploptera punctata]|uniref:non-specific serine/threonine protein kinase n=1 Tax=Diploptera punctata TaxID=6984 RepID=A0AAD8A9E3_DIPPU|nr:hypothetical protein L9F63_013838 [Diploptera punctata]